MIYAFFLTNAVMLYYRLAVDHKVSGPAYALPPPSSGSRWPGRHGLVALPGRRSATTATRNPNHG